MFRAPPPAPSQWFHLSQSDSSLGPSGYLAYSCWFLGNSMRELSSLASVFFVVCYYLGAGRESTH